MTDQTKHYLISGRVQGVGFRMFVHRQAVQLQLKGWVRNLNDGRVEAWVQGEPEALKKFEALIKVGPPRGRVEALIVNARSADPQWSEFSVRGDGSKPWPEES